jgi:hypothetical protein
MAKKVIVLGEVPHVHYLGGTPGEGPSLGSRSSGGRYCHRRIKRGGGGWGKGKDGSVATRIRQVVGQLKVVMILCAY